MDGCRRAEFVCYWYSRFGRKRKFEILPSGSTKTRIISALSPFVRRKREIRGVVVPGGVRRLTRASEPPGQRLARVCLAPMIASGVRELAKVVEKKGRTSWP